MTFHRAKGLEWQVVFVTGLERGLVPISWASTPDARAEERRLLHVALGRAEDTLRCSWARLRTTGGRRSARQPSPWLVDLEHAITESPVATVDRRARIGDALVVAERGHTATPVESRSARGTVTMHRFDERTQHIADAVFAYMRERLALDPVPLDHGVDADALAERAPSRSRRTAPTPTPCSRSTARSWRPR